MKAIGIKNSGIRRLYIMKYLMIVIESHKRDRRQRGVSEAQEPFFSKALAGLAVVYGVDRRKVKFLRKTMIIQKNSTHSAQIRSYPSIAP